MYGLYVGLPAIAILCASCSLLFIEGTDEGNGPSDAGNTSVDARNCESFEVNCMGSCRSECTTDFTAGRTTYDIPQGCMTVSVDVWGAGGGDGAGNSLGAAGGYSQVSLAVGSGSILNIVVGQPGGDANYEEAGMGGLPGGGSGGSGDESDKDFGQEGGGGGGGFSGVFFGIGAFKISNAIAIAGGGGGSGGGAGSGETRAGAGGGQKGQNGSNMSAADATIGGGQVALSGLPWQGGDGDAASIVSGNWINLDGGGGGGGGLFGGEGGHGAVTDAPGGAGGSGFTHPSATGASQKVGNDSVPGGEEILGRVNAGNPGEPGRVILTCKP